MKFDIHFCLVSDQAAANLLPILDNNFKPKETILLVSKAKKANAQYLEKTFKSKSIKVTIVDLIDEFDFGSLEDQLIDLVSQYEDQNIALNVTGGTKLMSIAASNAFTYVEKPIFYLDTNQNQILFLTKDINKQWLPSLPLETQNDIETYLSAYGASVINYSNPNANREKMISLVEYFINKYEKYVNLIPLLNMHASLSQSNGYKSSYTKSNKKFREIDELFLKLDYQKLIKYDGETIHFKNREIKDFLNGGWLEDYVYQQIKDIKHLEDIMSNANVANYKYKKDKNEYTPDNQGNKNEFDVIFIAKNKLHIIECKTQKMDKSAKPEEILYKLETLKDYGGLMTKKCLVSYFEVTEAVKNRANFLNIEIIQGKDLQRLKSKIQEWIGKKY